MADDGGAATNHELNVKAAVLVKSVGGKRLYIYPAYVTIGGGMNAPRWSPATSIEDAMGLLTDHMPEGWTISLTLGLPDLLITTYKGNKRICRMIVGKEIVTEAIVAAWLEVMKGAK